MRLQFYELPPGIDGVNSVPCGDGSPAGVYTDFDVKMPPPSETKHIIFIQGGGVCDSDENCQKEFKQEPAKFSSRYFPFSIDGDTILSADPIVNPEAHGYIKWLIPYCTQDSYLGSGNRTAAGLARAGSLHLGAFFAFFQEAMSSATVNGLIVVGTSAGAMGLANHMGMVRQIARELQVSELKTIFDSTLFSDVPERDYSLVTPEYVDHNQHPLCAIIDDEDDAVSNLPCCMSIHCMMRHPKGILDGMEANERFLLLDSTYDAHALAETMDTLPEDPSTFSAFANYGWAGAEYAGSRKTRVRETLHSLNTSVPILWLTPSCLTHTFLVPSLELESVRCRHANFQDEDYDVVCRDDAVGVRSTADGMHSEFTLWLSIHTWNLASVGGETVQTWASLFLTSSELDTGLQLDDCYGPNCVIDGSSAPNECQALFEPTDAFVPSPVWLQATVVCVLLTFVATLFLPFAARKRKVKGSVAHVRIEGEKERYQKPAIKTNGLTVTNKRGECLLEDVSLTFRPGTINGIIGRSGSGKSTLLKTLSGQLARGLSAKCLEGTQLDLYHTTLLGQHDSVALDNLVPNSFLESCAEIYGATPERFESVAAFAHQFFLAKTVRADSASAISSGVDPFYHTAISKMSGGQRRALAIAAALLTEPKVLLLDEPLSGLDSVASDKLVEWLSNIAHDSNHGCTVLFSVHQPSVSLLSAMDELVVMDQGKVVLCRNVQSFLASSLENGDVPIDVRIHNLLERGYNGEEVQPQDAEVSSQDLCDELGCTRNPEPIVREDPFPGKKLLICLVREFHQVPSLVRRLYLNFGINWADLIVLPLTFLVLALVFRFEDGSPVQVILASAFFIFIPVIIFQHHLLFAKDCWMAHRMELDDRRISCGSYMIASLSFSMTLPVISVVLSHVVGYAALGYKYDETFLVQTIFACLYLLVIVIFGRSLCLLFWGQYIYWKLYLICIFFNILFGGLVNSLHSVPDELLWLYALSYTYWAVSGAVLNQFQFNTGIGESPCSSFAACVLFDGNVLADASGFGLLSTTALAMGVLALALLGELVLEFILLRCRRTRYCAPESPRNA